ncbi:hypothetical protein [Streptomyces aidingensis]|uniref:Uncharacterized protein n=1 Tax=Streptomyces aidingensis TaxID=910347 RepID=A0A1I1H8H3_9ACTN|nr:hypothetical protein [Streptomyces aidingensis]SFC20449.1 hypothetical protein SAMN05421773_102300 [Streptomyces aidingensis]
MREDGFGFTDRILGPEEPETGAEDPNDALTAALPEGEADAWRRALHGAAADGLTRDMPEDVAAGRDACGKTVYV